MTLLIADQNIATLGPSKSTVIPGGAQSSMPLANSSSLVSPTCTFTLPALANPAAAANSSFRFFSRMASPPSAIWAAISNRSFRFVKKSVRANGSARGFSSPDPTSTAIRLRFSQLSSSPIPMKLQQTSIA